MDIQQLRAVIISAQQVRSISAQQVRSTIGVT